MKKHKNYLIQTQLCTRKILRNQTEISSLTHEQYIIYITNDLCIPNITVYYTNN